MRLERKRFRAEVKAASDAGDFEAVIATLGVIDHDGDMIAPGVFGGAVVSVVPNHDHSSIPLGKARIEERGNLAVAVGKFNLDIRAAKDWYSALKFDLANGDPVQEWSFGFQILQKMDEISDGKRVRVLQRLDTMEVSPVLRGAGMGTRTVAVKGRLSHDAKIAQLQSDYHEWYGEWRSETEVKARLERAERKSDDSAISEKDYPADTKVFRYKIESADLMLYEAVRKGAWDLGLKEEPEVFEIRLCAEGEDHDIVRFNDVLGMYEKARNVEKWANATAKAVNRWTARACATATRGKASIRACRGIRSPPTTT